MLDYSDLVAELFRDLEHVGREEYRAAIVAQLTHHSFQRVRRLGVKPDERLVHYYELRRMKPRELLLHAVRIRGDRLAEVRRQLEYVGKLAYQPLSLLRSDAVYVGDEIQIFYTRHKIVQIGVVGYVRRLFLAGDRILFLRDPVYVYVAGVECHDSGDALKRRRLARSVVADESVYLAAVYVKGQIGHRLHVPVFFR